MKGNAPTLARGVLVMAASWRITAAAILADALRMGIPLGRLGAFDANEARNLINAFSRAGNQLVAVVFTTVSIAVPLTANMYSLKFLEFFLKDRVNAGMLLLAATVALNTILVQYATKDDFVPMFALNVHFALLSLAFILLFPYLYYLFRFLHPNTLLERLASECTHHLDLATRRRDGLPEHRRHVSESFEHVANIAVRSVDRLDRNTAIESVHMLEDLAARYRLHKPRLPADWFEAEKELFLSFSSAAVDEANASRSWVEMKLLSQLRQMLGSALTRMHDVTSAVAKALRRFGLADGVRSDPRLRELTVEYFNTFIRRALNARDVRSVFILFDQYRILAEELLADDPGARPRDRGLLRLLRPDRARHAAPLRGGRGRLRPGRAGPARLGVASPRRGPPARRLPPLRRRGIAGRGQGAGHPGQLLPDDGPVRRRGPRSASGCASWTRAPRPPGQRADGRAAREVLGSQRAPHEHGVGPRRPARAAARVPGDAGG